MTQAGPGGEECHPTPPLPDKRTGTGAEVDGRLSVGGNAVRLGTAPGRAVVAAATLGAGMVWLDGSVVNVALRTIGDDLDASLAQLQWINNGYLLMLASLILLGGSLGDRFGRRRVFVVGTVLFAAASLLCGVAPSAEVLIVARLVQGVGGALLTPGSLAMIQGTFRGEDRARAIGAWSALGSVALAVGPLVGGLLVDHASWRWIFLINLPLAVATVLTTVRSVPETRDPHAPATFDYTGAVLASLALGATTYALIEWGGRGATWVGAVGVAAAVAFVACERAKTSPMMPPELFRDRTFSASNAMTFLVYAGVAAMFLFLVLQLQTVSGYGALQAGLATLPVTACIFFLAARGGALGARIGPRIPMTVGPFVMAGGTLLLLGVDADVSYRSDVLPGLTIFGLGFSLMVAPLTATVLAAAPDANAGIASGINNAVSRAGSLLAVAALPVVLGLNGEEYADPMTFGEAYKPAVAACAALLGAGGLVAGLTIPTRVPSRVDTPP